MQSGHLGRARKFSRIWARPLFLSATVATLLAAPLKRWAAILRALASWRWCTAPSHTSRRTATRTRKSAGSTPTRIAKRPPTPGSAPSTPAGAPQSRYPGRAEAVALLSIPRIGLLSVVLEAPGAPKLKLGPGHIPGTALPGEGGNFAVAGHRDTFSAPRFIRVDDVVQVESLGRKFRCRVVSTEMSPPKTFKRWRPRAAKLSRWSPATHSISWVPRPAGLSSGPIARAGSSPARPIRN